MSYTNPNSYINTIIGVSTFLSFYGYLLFYKATKPALSGYSLRSKFVCIILVLILCGLQSGILETMGALGAIPCRPPLPPESRSQSKLLLWDECSGDNPTLGSSHQHWGPCWDLPFQEQLLALLTL